MYENDTRKFNIKIPKMSDLYENRMKIKRKDCRIAISQIEDKVLGSQVSKGFSLCKVV